MKIRLIDTFINIPITIFVIFVAILTYLVLHNEQLIQEGFNSDMVIKLEPGYRIINMNETASQNINYVIIHTKNVKNEDVIITYKIENKAKKVELVHKIIVKEDN